MWKAALTLALCAASAQAQERTGQVIFVHGEAQRVAPDGRATRLAAGDAVYEGDLLRSGDGAHVQLLMSDQGRIALRPGSELRVESYRDELALLVLVRGAFRSITGAIGRDDKARYRIQSSRVVLGVRGTDHETLLRTAGEGAGTYNRVSAGGTYLLTAEGRIELDAGEAGFARLEAGAAPARLPHTPAFMLTALAPPAVDSGPALRESAPMDEQRLERAVKPGVRALGAPAAAKGRPPRNGGGPPEGRDRPGRGPR